MSDTGIKFCLGRQRKENPLQVFKYELGEVQPWAGGDGGDNECLCRILVTGPVSARLRRAALGTSALQKYKRLLGHREDAQTTPNPGTCVSESYPEDLNPLNFLVVQRRDGAHAHDHPRVQSKTAGSWFSE